MSIISTFQSTKRNLKTFFFLIIIKNTVQHLFFQGVTAEAAPSPEQQERHPSSIPKTTLSFSAWKCHHTCELGLGASLLYLNSCASVSKICFYSRLPWWLRRSKRLSTMRKTWVRSLGREDPLEKEMATHSSTPAWKIPQMEEPGELQSMRSQTVLLH